MDKATEKGKSKTDHFSFLDKVEIPEWQTTNPAVEAKRLASKLKKRRKWRLACKIEAEHDSKEVTNIHKFRFTKVQFNMLEYKIIAPFHSFYHDTILQHLLLTNEIVAPPFFGYF